MKGPFFVKNQAKFVLADICTDCAFCRMRTRTCIMEKCPFVPDYDEPVNDEDEYENKEED